MENEVQDLAAWLNERAPQADIDQILRGANLIAYQGEMLEARNEREVGIFRQLETMRRKRPETTIDEAAAAFDADVKAKIEIGASRNPDTFLSGTVRMEAGKPIYENWASGENQSDYQNVRVGDDAYSPELLEADALKAEIANIEARMKAGRVKVKNQVTGSILNDPTHYMRQKQEAERALQQLDPYGYIFTDPEQGYADKKERIEEGLAGKGYRNERFKHPLRHGQLKEYYRHADIIDMGSVGDAPKAPLQIASRTNAGVRRLAEQLEDYADDPILNEARARLERGLGERLALERDKAEANVVARRPGVSGPELLSYIRGEDDRRREAQDLREEVVTAIDRPMYEHGGHQLMRPSDAVGPTPWKAYVPEGGPDPFGPGPLVRVGDPINAERGRRRADRILESIDIPADDPSAAIDRVLMQGQTPERLYSGDFPLAARQGDAWFDKATGNPLGIQGPELPSSVNAPDTDQALNAPRSVNRWLNDLAGGYVTEFGERETINYEPQVNITEATTRFSDGLRQLGARVNKRTGQAIWPELARVKPNIRSAEDLQLAVDFIINNASSRGLSFTRFDEETGKQVKVLDPGVDDVMGMMRISKPQQRDLALALGQIKLARDTSYSDRTGVPAGSEIDVFQDPRYRFAAMGGGVATSMNESSARAGRKLATELRKIQGGHADATKAFIGVPEGEEAPKVDRVYKGMTPQQAYDATLDLSYGTPEKARANADENRMIRIRMKQEAERRREMRPGEGGPPPGPSVPEGFRPSSSPEVVRATNAPFGVEQAKRGMQGQPVMNTTPPQMNISSAQLVNREINNRRAPAQEALQRVVNTQSPTPVDYIQSEVVGRQTNASSPTTPSSGSIISEMGDGGVPTQDAPRNNVPIVTDTISRDDVPVAPTIGADQEINLEINNRTAPERAAAQRATAPNWLQGKKKYAVPAAAAGIAGLGGYALYEQNRREEERRNELIRGIR